MQYVDFKHDGLKVSRFGLGCMRFPTFKTAKGTTVINEDEAIEMVRYAIDHGVNYIDTAYVYEGSEVVVGKALRDGYRERVILSTKQPTSKLFNGKEEEQQTYFEEQLNRLQTDHFDVYFLHNLGVRAWGTAQRLNGYKFVSGLKDQGLIKYVAGSLHSDYEHFLTVADAYPWDLMMLQYNYYDRFNQAGEKGVKYVADKGIPLVIMESNHGGMLAANVPDSVRKSFSDNPEMPDYERSLKWLINQPEPTVILNGVSSMEQLKQNLEVFNKYEQGCLTQKQVDEYDVARGEWNKLVKVPCTGCNYCMPCPKGVNIPGIFDLYNMLARAQDKATVQPWIYAQMFKDTETDASRCVECKICETKCPQAIKVSEMLKEVHEAFKD